MSMPREYWLMRAPTGWFVTQPARGGLLIGLVEHRTNGWAAIRRERCGEPIGVETVHDTRHAAAMSLVEAAPAKARGGEA